MKELPEMLTFNNENEALKFAKEFADRYFDKFDGEAIYGRINILKL